MTTTFNRSLRRAYGFSILILLVVSLVSYIALENLLDSDQEVTHSGVVMQKLEQVLSVMKDAETGQRGFLLTGRADYLEPYNSALGSVRQIAVELSVVTANNKGQQANISAIRHFLNVHLAILQKVIEKKQRGELIGATDLDAGKSAMDDLRRAVARAEADERIILSKKTDRLNLYTGLVPGFFVFAALLAMGY